MPGRGLVVFLRLRASADLPITVVGGRSICYTPARRTSPKD